MVGLVEEAGATGSMSGAEDDFDFPAAEVEDLSVLEVVYLTLVSGHELGNVGRIGSVDPDFGEIVDSRTGMVGMDMGSDEGDGL